MKHRKSKPRDLQTLRDPNADEMERTNALAAIASDHLYEVEPLVEQLVTHDFYFLRAEAIMCLVGMWKREKWLPTAFTLLASKSEPSTVRTTAATALAMFHRTQRKQTVQILSELATAVQTEESESGRAIFYRAFLNVLHCDSPDQVPSDIYGAKINWTEIEKYAQ